jgi:hypothetical protein
MDFFLVVKWKEYEAENKNAQSYLHCPICLHGILFRYTFLLSLESRDVGSRKVMGLRPDNVITFFSVYLILLWGISF